jgi:hypothetical protein
MAPHSSLRASDADRDAVAELLRAAAVEGRLEPDELEERLHAALRARTYGDLHRLLSDLPATPIAWERHGRQALPAARTVLAIALKVLLTLAVVAGVLALVAVMTTWWVLWALVWFGLCGRRCSTTRLGAGCAWRAPARAHRIRPVRPAGLR